MADCIIAGCPGGDFLEYEIKYAKRRTVTLKVREGKLYVIAPIGTNTALIEELIYKHRRWIAGKVASQEKRGAQLADMSEADISLLKKEARTYLTSLTEYYASLMGAEYGKIRITSARGRFGSCSSEKNISYSYRLMLYPAPAREYVVVHELAHTFEMNHSKKFYAIIERILPDYKERKKLLK